MPRRSATRVITVLNRKGGVGKTHVCWLIASLAADHDKRVLVIDLDPQANISGSFLNEIPSVGVERLFDPTADPQIGPLICRAFNLPVDVIPASPQLEPFVLCSSQAWEQCDLHLSLAAALSDVSDDYDYILLDCPPNLALTTTAALCASDFVIVPLEAGHWGALGTQHVAALIDHVQATSNSRLQLLGYVVSRFKARRTYQQSHLFQLRAHFGDDAFETVIPDLAAFERAVTDRIPITHHSPSSHAAHIAREFFHEVEARCQQKSASCRSPRTRPSRRRRGVLTSSVPATGSA